MANTIQTEVWVADIKEQLFPSNAFLSNSIDDSIFADNKTVNLPQAGTLPTVERNRNVLPAPIVNRVDTVVSYDLDQFTSDPSVVKNIDEIETSYDKRQSVLRQHINQLNNALANWMQYHWSATVAAAIKRTTGSSRAAVISGATGNRKQLALADVFAAKQALDDMDVPEEGRVLLLPSYMYNDLLLAEKTSLLSLEFTGEARMTNGMLESLLGFRIYKRGKNNVLSYTNAGTPVPRTPDAAALTSANAAALAWHPEFVRRALGEVLVYANENQAAYYGSLFSAEVRAGGRKAYSDGTGVVAIVEDAA